MNASQTLLEKTLLEKMLEVAVEEQACTQGVVAPDLLATICRDAAANSQQYIDDSTVPHGGE